MLDPVRQAAPPPAPTPPQVATRPASAIAPYVSGWNPPPAPVAAPASAPAPEPKGFFSSLGSAITSGDVRAVASTVRDGIGDATEAGRNGITSAVNWTGETIGQGADFARSQITGDDWVSQGLRGAITGAEGLTRFQVGVAGGVLREGVSLVGTVGQLGTTLAEAQVSPEARQELTDTVVGAVRSGAGATGDYLSSVANDPSRLGGDLKGAWNATSGFVGDTASRYGQAIAEGRTEEIGLDVGTVATYVVPVGGGPARALLGGAARATTEGVARGTASAVAREAAPGLTRTAANEAAGVARTAANDTGPLIGRASDLAPAAREIPPEVLHAKAEMAGFVYGRGTLPAGTRQVTDAGELARLNLDATMLDRGAFHAEVYATGEAGAEAYTIAFRGSGGRVGDWVTNAQQGIGLPSNHYAQALEIGRSVARADPGLDVSFVGHSLGGGLASHAANASGREAITFNAAGLHATSRAEGAAVAAENGLRTGTADNFAVPGEFLTSTQNIIPFVPRAFGETHALPLVRPEGLGAFSQYGPLGPINRHMMNWVLASTASRLP